MLIIVLIVALVVIYLVFVYNRLVGLKNRIKQAFSDITVVLKQRADTVAQLVPIVKGYAKHEKEIFEKVAELRSKLGGGSDELNVSKAMELDKQLTGVISKIFAVAESYPELKASENFKQLQNAITELEEKIQRARRYYNAVVRDYNNTVMMFPTNIIANLFGFKEEKFYEIEENLQNPPEIKF